MLLITIILFLFNRSLRKKIQIHGLHDLSSLPLSSSPSRTPFLLDLLFFFFSFFFLCLKNSRWESPGDVATLRRCDVATLRRCDVATLRRCDVATLRRCDVATLRRCDVATLRRCDVATLRRFDVGTSQRWLM